MKISLVIPTYNEAGSLSQVINSIKEQTLDKDRFEVIFVDSRSKDGSVSIIEEYTEYAENTRLVFDDLKKGPGPARNKGVEEAENRLVAFVDADCVMDKDFLEAYLGYFENHDCKAAIGASRNFSSNLREKIWQEKRKFSEQFYDEESPLFDTRNAAILKDFFQDLDGFDPEFQRGEDEELGIRIEKAGEQVHFVEEAVIYHDPDRSLLQDLSIKYTMGKYDYLIDRKHRSINWKPNAARLFFLPLQILLILALSYLNLLLLVPYALLILIFYRSRSRFYTNTPYRRIPARILLLTLSVWLGSAGYFEQILK